MRKIVEKGRKKNQDNLFFVQFGFVETFKRYEEMKRFHTQMRLQIDEKLVDVFSADRPARCRIEDLLDAVGRHPDAVERPAASRPRP